MFARFDQLEARMYDYLAARSALTELGLFEATDTDVVNSLEAEMLFVSVMLRKISWLCSPANECFSHHPILIKVNHPITHVIAASR